MIKRQLVLALLVAWVAGGLMAGCVKEVVLTDAGKKVQVTDKLINPDDCKKLSTIRVTNQNTVEGFELTDEEMVRALEINARNTAADVGANVVVPLGAPKDATQRFSAYKCE